MCIYTEHAIVLRNEKVKVEKTGTKEETDYS